MEPLIMKYDSDDSARAYQEWSLVKQKFVHGVTIDFIGHEMKYARILDLGCGSGILLKKCLKEGASYCLGVDLSESMVKNGLADMNQNTNYKNTTDQLHFIIDDCSKPFNKTYDQFDFVISHFLLHSISNENSLQNIFHNAYNLLKPGGKILIAQGCLPITKSDQALVAEVLGLQKPIRSDFEDDPCYAHIPAVIKKSENGSNEAAFAFSQQYWSKEKLIKTFHKIGFVKEKTLSPDFSKYMPESMARGFEMMTEPDIFFLVAEKDMK